MNGMGVSLRDYEGIQGFGISSAQEVEELNKALAAGTSRPVSGSGGDNLRVESLEATLRVVTSTLQHIKFWKEIPKLPAFSTVEEYNLLKEYGADAGAFTNEGDLPEEQDSVFERKTALVKFLGTTRSVTHPMTLVRPAHGNVIGLETQNGAIWLTERLERALFFGRSDLISQEFDGLAKQILDGVGIADPNTDLYDATDLLKAGCETVVKDMRGEMVGEDELEDAANEIVQNFGIPTDFWTTPMAMSNLAQKFYPRERVNLPAPDAAGKVGFAVKQFESQAGPINFKPDIFIRPGNKGVKAPPASATSTKAPTTPTSATCVNAGADAKSMFKAADAGAYLYKVTAINRFGESAPRAGNAGITFAEGEGGTITIVDGGGTYPATAYKIYRTIAPGNTTDFQLMTTIAKPGGAIVYTDRNWFLPGCAVSFLTQHNLQNYAVRQLAPMLKIPLATIAASIRWMQLIYLAFILYTPKKNVIFLNVKDRKQVA